MQILNKLQDDSYPGMLVAKEIIERVDWIAQIGGLYSVVLWHLGSTLSRPRSIKTNTHLQGIRHN